MGIGVSCYVEITGQSLPGSEPQEVARVVIHGDGSATVFTGTSPHGQGHDTAWSMIALPGKPLSTRHGGTACRWESSGTGAFEPFFTMGSRPMTSTLPWTSSPAYLLSYSSAETSTSAISSHD